MTSRTLLVFLVSLVVTPMQVSAQTFTDVPTTHFAFSFIETFAATGITSGCTPETYCPDDPVTRAQMAIFVERGMNGGSYQPPPASGTVFLDVAANSFGASFIEQFFLDGITGGCGGQNYCPGRSVTRAEMAVFILRAMFGSDYQPPSATGQLFADVGAGDFAAAFIEQFSREGITGGCGGGNYCPDDLVTRAQMAVFLVRAFDLSVGTPPTANAGGPYMGVEGTPVALDGSGSTDSDNDIVSYEWDLDDDGAFDDATGVNPTFGAASSGVFTIGLQVTDADGASDTDSTIVTVNNVAPIANAGGPYSGDQGVDIVLDGSASSDPGNDITAYAWDLDNDGAFDDAAGVTATFNSATNGDFTVGLQVTDADGDSNTVSTTVTVNNVAPTANAGGPYSGEQGADIALDGSASSDPGNDITAYAWDLDNDGAFDDAAGVAATFNSAAIGDFTVGLQVMDADGDSDSTTTTVTVGNAAPIADAGTDQSGVSQGAMVILDGSLSFDPGGDLLTYAWTLTLVPTGSVAVLSDATAVGPTFNADLAGTYVAELVVNDGTADSAPDAVTVIVDDLAPAAPVGVTASGEDGQVNLDWADNTEPDLAASPYRVHRSETQGGPYTDVSGLLSTSSYLDTPVDNDTTYYYVVTAEDAGGNVSADSAEVSVTPNGPVHAYWTMEEGAGVTAADTVGTSDGTLVGTTWTTGVSGGGLDFNGSTDRVVIDNTSALQITGTQITLMAWIYPRDGSESPGPGIPSGSRVISKRTDAGGNEVFGMKLEDYRLCFRLNESSCQWSSHILVLNEWVHVAMVYDGVDKRIYVNGVLDDSGPEARTAPIEASSRPVHLGMREDEGRFFNGVLDEVEIYNRALSAAEVQAISGAIVPPAPAPGLRFTDITGSAGTAGPADGGRGIMFAEVNNDSLPDYYLTNILQNTAPRREFYFENTNGAAFTEVAVARGIDDSDGGSYGAVWADLDNDGDYDLFSGSTWDAANPTTGFPENNNVYRNDGVASGSFSEVTAASILSTEIETRGVTSFDMDGDGDLDLFGVSGGSTPGVSEAYLNGLIGGAGAFAFTPHVGGVLTTAVAMNGVTDTDFDNDGDIDVLSANRLGEFAILQNDGSGIFTQISPATLGINDVAGTGITPADIDNDGDLDLLLTAQNLQSYLYRRENSGSYVLHQSFVNGWMGSFADLDNDGDLDLVFSGDHRSYLNDGSGTFGSGQSVPVSEIIDARGIAFADIDSDGDLDFAIGAKGGRNTLVRNDIDAAAGNWLRVELVSPSCQAGAFGARTRIYAAGDLFGTLLGMREARGNHGYHAQNEPVLHFGLGAEASVDVVVDFLDGTQTIVPGVVANQRILIEECP